jgi:hypothetical protein
LSVALSVKLGAVVVTFAAAVLYLA